MNQEQGASEGAVVRKDGPSAEWAADLVESAREWAREQGGCPANVKRNETYVATFFHIVRELGFGEQRAESVTPEMVEAFRHDARLPRLPLNVRRKVAGRPMAPNTIANTLPHVRAYLAFRGNPIAGKARLWRQGSRPESVYVRYLNDAEELRALLNAATDPRLQAMVVLMGPCQLRAGEALAVRVGDLQLGPGRSTVQIVRGKFGKARRVSVPPHAVACLMNAAQGLRPEETIWPLSRITLWRRIRDLGRSVGLPNVAPHMLRRSVARFARRANVRLEFVQRRMGHASSETTLRYYVGDDSEATDGEDLAKLDACVFG